MENGFKRFLSLAMAILMVFSNVPVQAFASGDVCAHDNKATVTVAASCTTDGSTTITCSDCGTVISSEVLPAKGAHDYQEQVVEPKCTEAGRTDMVCSVCGDTYTVENSTVEALGHEYADGKCIRCEAPDPDAVVPETTAAPEPEVDEDVVYVQGLINALPASIKQSEAAQYQAQFEEANAAYGALTEEQKAQIVGAERLNPVITADELEDTTIDTEAELAKALAVNGNVVELGGDIEVTTMIEIPAGVTVTLDLAGYDIIGGWNGSSTTNHIYALNNKGVLTIKDSVGTGSITARGIYVQAGAVLTVNGAKIVAQDWNGGAGVWAYGSTSQVYLNNATIVGNTGVVSSEGYLEINGGTYTCYSGIDDDGNQETAPTYNIRAYNGLKITDGTFTSRHGVIYFGGGVGKIEDGSYIINSVAEITSNVVYVSGSAELTIEDGEFKFNNRNADSGAAVLVDGNNAQLTINDGTYVGMNGMVSTNANTVINGGSFDTVLDYNHYGSIESAVTEGATITVGETAYIKTESGLVDAASVVAMIGNQGYETLEEAFAAAADGATITVLTDAIPTLTSQRAITKAAVIDLGGNTLTLTEDDLYFGTTTFKNGTIVVDPSVKPSTAVFWMFANQTLTFDKVKIVATGVTGTYLIGLDGKNSDLNLLNGSEILIENTTALDLDVICVNGADGNDIVINNSKVNVTNLDGRVLFRGNYTIKGNSELYMEGITKAGIRIEAGQTLSIEDTAKVTITGEPRDGGIELTDLSANYNVAATASVTAVVNAPVAVAKIGDTKYATLQAAVEAAVQMTAEAVTIEILAGTYNEDLKLTNAVVTVGDAAKRPNITFQPADGASVTLAGTVTLGYRNQGTGASMWNGEVTFKGIKFDHAESAVNSLDIQDVKGITLDGCTLTGDGEYGITSARGNATTKALFTGCTFNNGAMQVLGLIGANLKVTGCTLNNFSFNVQAGATPGMTIENSTFNLTLTDAHVGDSFYAVRTNACPVNITGTKVNVDSTVTGTAADQAKWGIFWARNESNAKWTVSDVEVNLTDAAAAQTELLFIKNAAGETNGPDRIVVSGLTGTEGLLARTEGYVKVQEGTKTFIYKDGVVTESSDKAVAYIGETGYETLADAVANVADGGEIKLINDVIFNETTRVDNNGYYEGLYYVGDKSFTIDLNDKTITHDGSVNDYLLLFKNAGSKPNVITFKNGTIDAGKSAYCAICTSTTSTQKITINVENINIVGNNSNGAVLKIRGGAELNVKAGTVITGKDSYVGIESVGTGTVVNIYEGAEIYQNGTSNYVGSLAGVSYGATLNVYGGKGTSAKGGFIAMTSGGTINVSGGEWTANGDGTAAYDNSAVLIAQFDKNTYPDAVASVVNVTGGTFKGGYNCYGGSAEEVKLVISGGTFSENPSAYLAKNYKITETNGTFGVEFNESLFQAYLVVDGKNVYYTTLEEAIAAAPYEGTVYLTQDITLSAPIVTSNRVKFNGNGHTVTATGLDAFRINANTTFTNMTIENNTAFGRCINTRTDGINLTLNSVKLVATGTNSQPLTIGGQDSNASRRVSVKLQYTNIDAGNSGYGIIAFVPAEISHEGTGYEVKGYAAFYLKEEAEGSIINIGNSAVVTGTNTHSGIDNNFGTFVFESSGHTVNIKNGAKLNAAGNGSARQALFSFFGESDATNKVYLSDGNVNLSGNDTILFCGSNITNLELYAQDADIAQQFRDAGYSVNSSKVEPPYLVHHTAWAINDDPTQYGNIKEAYARAKSGDTLILMADAVNNPIEIKGKNLTFDLNGHTWEQENASTTNGCNPHMKGNNGGMIVTDANLTIIDSSKAGTGKMVSSVGNLILAKGSTSVVTLTGGTYVVGKYAHKNYLNQNAYIVASLNNNVTTDNVIKVSGGKFTSNGMPFEMGYMVDGAKDAIAIEEAWFNNDMSAWIAKKTADGVLYAQDIQNGIYHVGYGIVVATDGTNGYTTLAEAVEQAPAGATVTLLKAATGAGVVIDKNITIDLNGKTYTVNKCVGSTGTETLGFQILKGNIVTIKNGTLAATTVSEGKPVKMLVQNYANLTLTGVTLDGTGSAEMQYVLSNNSGNITVNGATSITAPANAVAFDVYDYSSAGYAVPSMTVNTTGTITGKIEVSNTATLAISNGTFTVPVAESWCAAGYIPAVNTDANGNVTYTVKSGKYIVRINGQQGFETLEEAVAAAYSGDTINLYESIKDADVTINNDVILDLGGNTITDAYIKVTGNVTIQNGSIKNDNEPYPLVVQNGGELIVADVAIEASKSDRAIWVRSGSSLIFNSGSILATKGANNTKTNLIAAIYTDSNTDVTINGGTIAVDTPNNKAVAIYGNYTDANVTVNGGKISTSGKNYSYGINVDGDITVTGGEIVTNEKCYGYSSGITYGYNYALYTALGDVTISGGKITTNGHSGYIVNVGRTYSSNDQTVTISGGEFTNNLTETDMTAGGHKAPVLIWENSNSEVTATITNGTVKGFSEALLRGDSTDLTISGGTFDKEVKEEFCAEGYIPSTNEDGTYGVKIGEFEARNTTTGRGYETFAEAVVAAQSGNTVTLLKAATGAGVVIDKNITIDLGGFTYTVNKCVGSSGTETLGFQILKGNNVTIKNGTLAATTVTEGKPVKMLVQNYANLTLTDVTLDGRGSDEMKYVLSNNSGNITVNGATSITAPEGAVAFDVYDYSSAGYAVPSMTVNTTGKITGKIEVSETAKLAISGGTFTVPVAESWCAAGYIPAVNTDANGNVTSYTVKVGEYVVRIGQQGYETFEDALNAVEDGETITILNATGSEINKEIDFTKDISFTITGKAPNYELPVITFQNATVTIKDAEILIPELDARQGATINVVDSTVRDAGGDSIVKSYYNGAINISGTSVVYTMQVTTMGYITISDTAKLNATWQTNVYGNGLIIVEDDATFATAAMHITGKDYSDRDNTDADRVGKPAEIIVDGAKLIVGKVLSSNGADYSYNSAQGINIGTIDGKSAVLNIKNGATVNVYMADGETANIGAGGTVTVDGSSFALACRKDGGKVTLANAGTVYVTGKSTVAANVTGEGWVYMNGVTLDADTKLNGAKVAFINGTNTVAGSTIENGFFSVGVGQNAAANTAAAFAEANGITLGDVTVNVSGNAIIGSNGATYSGWVGSAYSADKTQHKYVLNIEESLAAFGYLHVSKDGELNVTGHSTNKYTHDNANVDFYAGDFIINGEATLKGIDAWARSTKMSADHADGVLNIIGTNYESSRHNGSTTGDSLIFYKAAAINVDADSTVEIDNATTLVDGAEMNIAGDVTAKGAVTGNGTITLTELEASFTAPANLPVVSGLKDYKPTYANGVYKLTAKDYVAEIVGGEKYESLAEALTAAQDGATVKLLWTDGHAPIAMNGAVYGKSVTITGNATVDWSKGFLFVGRGGNGNGTVIFDGANLTSASNSASTGIHVSGREKGTNDKYDGTLVIKNSTIELDYLINKGTMTLDNSTLTVKNGFSVGGRPGNETESGVDATATLTLHNNSKVIVNNHNGMGLGYEAIGVMDIDATSSFETTQKFLVTAKGTMNVEGNVTVAGTLTNNGTMNIGKAAKVAADNIDGAGKLVLNAEGMAAGVYANINCTVTGFTGTVEVINNPDVYPEIANDKIVLVAYVAKIGEVRFKTLDEAFAAAKDDDEVVILVKGNYSLDKASGKNITITGAATDGEVSFGPIGAVNMGGASVTFNKVTLSYAPNSTFKGLQHCGDMVYNDCIIMGQAFLYGTSETFNKCTFVQNTANYNVWTYGADVVNFNNCIFNSAGKSVLIYSDQAGEANNVTVTGCTFEATDEVEGKAAIEMDSSLMNAEDAIKLTVSDSTVNGFAAGSVSGNSLWNNKMGNEGVNNDITVTVDDVVVLKPIRTAQVGTLYYTTLEAAVNAAKDGDTVTLLTDFTGNGIVIDKDLILDLGGKTYTVNKCVGSTGTQTLGFQILKDNDVTIKNGTLAATTVTEGKPVKMLVQNYANLTLTDVTLDGTGSGAEMKYVLSNNSGDITVNGATSITAPKGAVAFDVYDYSSAGYAVPSMTVETTGTITGKIEVSDTAKLAISSGIYTVEIEEDWCADGYIPADNGNGTYGVKVGSYVARVNGGQGYETIDKAFEAVKTGDTITLLADCTMTKEFKAENMKLTIDGSYKLTLDDKLKVYGETELDISSNVAGDVWLGDGATVKNSTINGDVFVGGKVTFTGDNQVNMLYDYGTLTDYYGTPAPMEWTVEPGASLNIINKARYGLGYGDNVTITGNLTDATTARDTLTEADRSFFTHGLVAQESSGWNKNSSFTVKDAYVTIGSNNSFGNKPGNYGGTYTFNFENAILDASRITFYEADSKTTFTFTDSDVKTGTFMTRDDDSVFTLTNTKLLSTATTNGNDEGNYNEGVLNLVDSSLTYSAALTNNGTITMDAESVLTAPSIIGTGNITIDVTGYTGGAKTIVAADMSGFTGTIKVVGAAYTADENGITITKAYAKIGDTYFATLQAAIDAAKNGDTVTVLADCAENVTVSQAPDVKITIDGNEKTMTGTITVDGKSARYATAGLTIKNFNFDATSINSDACINLGAKGNNNTRYTSNVTVEGCTFTGNTGKVAIKQYTGGCHNLTVTGCEATGMHSLLQLANVEQGLTITDTEVTGKRGISIGQSSGVVIDNVTFDVETYGIRADGKGAYDLTVKDSTITADLPIVVRNNTADGYNLTVDGNTLNGSNDKGYEVIFTSGDDGTYVEPEVGVKLNVTEGTEMFPAYTAKIGDLYYGTLQIAVDNAVNGDIVTLVADTDEDVTIEQVEGVNITVDGGDHNYSGTIYLDGNSRNNGAETLTIQNFHFTTDAASHDFISCDWTGGDVRYAHNVTVKDSTFTATGSSDNEVVGMRYRQCYNMTVENVTATNMHSLMWATGSSTLVIDKANVENCLNGISVGTSKNVTVENSTIKTTADNGYGIRADGSVATSLTVKDNTIEAFAPVLVRKASADYILNIQGSNTVDHTNTDGYNVVISTADYTGNGTMTQPTGNVKVNLEAGCGVMPFAVYPIVANVVDTTSNVTTHYVTAQAAIDAAKDGDQVNIYKNVTEDLVVAKSITIDLSQTTLNGQIKFLSGTSTVKNGTVTGAKDLIYVGVKDGVENTDINVTLDKTLTVKSTTDCALLVYDGNVTSNGKLISESTNYAAVTSSGNDYGNVTINGTVEGKDAGIYWAGKGNLTIADGANVTGSTGIYVKQGNVTIGNATITGTGAKVAHTANGSGGTSTGDAITVDAHGEGYDAPVVTINTANLASTNAHLIGIYGGTVNVASGDYAAAADAIRIEGGKLDIAEGVNITAAECAVFIKGGDVTTAGNLTSTGAYAAIQGNGNADSSGNVTINGGSVTNANSIAIYWPQNGNLTVNGGVITGTTGIYVKDGTIAITGGEINATGDKIAYAPNGNGANSTGDALVIDTCSSTDALNVTVTGGTFTSVNGEAVASYAESGKTAYTGFLTTASDATGATGATVNTLPAAETLAESRLARENGDGTWTIVKAVEDAVAVTLGATAADDVYYTDIDTAMACGTNVMMLVDCQTNMALVEAGTVLDLNGHTLNAPILISFGDIVDGEAGGNGKLVVSRRLVMDSDNNKLFMPIKDAEGYYKVYKYYTVNYDTTAMDNGVIRFRYMLKFNNPEGYKALADTANSGVDVIGIINWTGKPANKIVRYNVSASTISGICNANYAAPNKNYGISINVGGLDSLASGAQISCSFGVDAADVEYLNTADAMVHTLQ